MQYPRVKKSAQRPMAADTALSDTPASIRVVDVAVDAAEFAEHPNPQLKVAIVLSCEGLTVDWQSPTGRAMRARVACGTSSVMPAAMPYRTRWQGAGQMLLMSFSPEFLAALDAPRGAVAELRPAWSEADPFLSQLGLSVLEAHRRHLATRTYVDAAAEVAMAHLLHRYGAAPQTVPQPLAPPRVARVLELIEAGLGEDLSIATLAAAVSLSPNGFARGFARAVGVPPHRYVLMRRCERAKQLLAGTALPIASIASDLGFSSQAQLSTAFVKATGVTPARYRAASRER